MSRLCREKKNKAEGEAFEKLYEVFEKSQTQLDNTYEMVSTLPISTTEQPKYESTIKIWIRKNFYMIMIFLGALMALWSHL